MAPVEIVHPALLTGGCRRCSATVADDRGGLQAGRADTVGAAFREAARAMVPVRVAENLKLRADARLAAAETALGSAISVEARNELDARHQAGSQDRRFAGAMAAARRTAENQYSRLRVKPRRRGRGCWQLRRRARRAGVTVSVGGAGTLGGTMSGSVLLQGPSPQFGHGHGSGRPIGTHIFHALERTNGEMACDGTSSRWPADVRRRDPDPARRA